MQASRYINFTIPGRLPFIVQCSRADTAWYINQKGFLVTAPSNTVRIGGKDFATKQKGLLVETEATNICLDSRDLSSGTWDPGAFTISAVRGIDNTGTSASKLTAGSGDAECFQAITASLAQYTFSAFIKKSVTLSEDPGKVYLSADGGTTWKEVFITNSWARYSVTATTDNPEIHIKVSTPGGVIHVDACQVETGPVSTSPIITTSSAVTRNADEIYIDIDQTRTDNWFNPYWGTFVVTGEPYNLTTEQCMLYINNGAGDINIGIQRNPQTKLNAGIDGEFLYSIFNSCDRPGTLFSAAFSYIDGEQLASLSGRTPIDPPIDEPQAASFDFTDCSRVWIGSKGGPSTNPFNGNISSFAFYDAALNQDDLNQLTLTPTT